MCDAYLWTDCRLKALSTNSANCKATKSVNPESMDHQTCNVSIRMRYLHTDVISIYVSVQQPLLSYAKISFSVIQLQYLFICRNWCACMFVRCLNYDQIVLIEAPIDRRGGLFLSLCDSFAIRFAFRVFLLHFIILF